jgi:hypothetical protein
LRKVRTRLIVRTLSSGGARHGKTLISEFSASDGTSIEVQPLGRRMGHRVQGRRRRHHDLRPPATPQPRHHHPRRQLPPAREAPLGEQPPSVSVLKPPAARILASLAVCTQAILADLGKAASRMPISGGGDHLSSRAWRRRSPGCKYPFRYLGRNLAAKWRLIKPLRQHTRKRKSPTRMRHASGSLPSERQREAGLVSAYAPLKSIYHATF